MRVKTLASETELRIKLLKEHSKIGDSATTMASMLSRKTGTSVSRSIIMGLFHRHKKALAPLTLSGNKGLNGRGYRNRLEGKPISSSPPKTRTPYKPVSRFLKINFNFNYDIELSARGLVSVIDLAYGQCKTLVTYKDRIPYYCGRRSLPNKSHCRTCHDKFFVTYTGKRR